MRWLALVLAVGCASGPSTDGSTPTGTTDTITGTATGTTATTPVGVCGERDATYSDSSVAARLQEGIEQARVDMGLTGIAAALHDSNGTWLGASGEANVAAGDALDPDHLFRIGSVSKTFTGVLVMQLQDDGLLDVDDPIDTWVPGWWGGEGITLRHLLSHTSGIVSYNYTGNFDGSQHWEPLELLQWAMDHEPALRFEPGAEHDYSNTNFVLLGLAVEAATGQPFDVALRERILDPLEMTGTFLIPDEDAPCYQARGYSEGVDVTDSHNPSFGWAAGGMLSNPGDVNRFQLGLHGGELLSAEALAEMTAPYVLNDGADSPYGLGIFASFDSNYGWTTSHSGGIAGFSSYMFSMSSWDVSISLLINEEAQDLDVASAYLWSRYLDVAYP